MSKFKPRPVIKVGTKDWETLIPRPPKHATHAKMVCHNQTYDNGSPKTATLPLQDFGCFQGVSGDFNYIRMDRKGKVSEEYDGTWYWNGTQVEGIEDL